MKLALLAAVSLAALSLGACADPFASKVVTFDMAAGGANANPSTGITLGYAQLSGHFVPVVNKAGTGLLTVSGPCGTQQIPATYGILAGNASATVNSGSGPTATNSAATGPNETVAVAANRMSSTGDAAVVLAEGGGAAPSAAVVVAHGTACPAANTTVMAPPTPTPQ